MGRTAERPSPVGRALAWLLLAPPALLGVMLAYLPWPVGLWVGRRLGDLAYWVLSGRRAVARENLERAFAGQRSAAELDRLCRESFRHLGMTLVEACTFFFRPPSVLLSRVDVEGVDHLKAAAAHGRGTLLLTAHLGNWELLAAAHAHTGYPLSVVVRPLDSAVLDRVVTRFRERGGVEVIPKRRALRGVREALRRGRMVGILLDQNASRREGVFVPFFGEPASTSKSLALLALWSGAPVVPVFIQRDTAGSHRVTIEPALPPPATGDREEDVAAFTAAFSRVVESRIRRSPEQWFWMHRRWRTRPGVVAVALALLLWGGVAGAQELGLAVAPLRAAAQRGEVAVLSGAAFVEPTTPRGGPAPLAGVAIAVLPPARAFLGDLETVKTHARDSAARYMQAAGEVRKIQGTYEQALRQAGAGDLVFATVTDAAGRFELKGIPAGDWVLLGRHEVLHARPPKKVPQQERASRLFLLEPPPSGYRAVIYWLMPFRVEAGGQARVELHDRNPWLTGVTEEKAQGVK
ncbi:MAG: hypothetical protein A3G97_00785 [Candidatus Rokubacteria bacterium RIFCSPLOWO2_12_FULL_69_21]|nr:MAG: hypothetical protein A3G97_00785 [Candidatus Rokubacteria bacterium RIFCSPLOWO2_12_FULL_69_21]